MADGGVEGLPSTQTDEKKIKLLFVRHSTSVWTDNMQMQARSLIMNIIPWLS